MTGDTPVRATLPKALPNGGGYPPFFDANATKATMDTLYFEVSSNIKTHNDSVHMAAM